LEILKILIESIILMKFRKVCLINPPTTRDFEELFFPMGLLVLATLLKKNCINVEIVDFDLELRHFPELRAGPEVFEEYALKKLEGTRADVFGIGSICSNFPVALRLAMNIRERWPESKIILGGPQPSSVPQKTMAAFPGIDAVVIGEGERTFLDLLHCDWSDAALKSIQGICFRCDGEIHTTCARPLIEDLDELPIPDFSLLNLREYIPFAPNMALIEAGRGCPFRCSFCSTAEFWSRKYRAKSPGRILEEMRALNRDYQLECFPLTHDNFTTSPKYLRKFCEYFIEHNREGFIWSSSARTDTLDPEDLPVLKKSGCCSLFFGVDSGSARVQKEIDKHLDLEQFKEILTESVNQGIQSVASFVIGFPGETKGEIDETILLGLWAKSRGAKVQFHRLAPLAGTRIYHDNKARLKWDGLSSDMSFGVLVSPEIVPKMTEHPELFSSFYTIPTPQLEPFNLLCLTNFFYVIVNRVGQSIEWIFKRAKKTPTELFSEWVEYTRGCRVQESFEPNYIVNSFNELL